jgi:phosphate-selective porin OprO/OprP
MLLIAMPARRLFALVLAVAAAIGIASQVGAQSPPPWPTMTPTAEPSPSPHATPPAAAEPTPTPTPAPKDESPLQPPPEDPVTPEEPDTPDEIEESDEPQEALETDEAEQPSDAGEAPAQTDPEETEQPAEELEEEEGIAHTPHGPFDVDDIEPEPIKLKWSNFVAAVRGLSRYSLFDGMVKFRVGGKIQVDGTAGNGNAEYEEYYLPIESEADFRRIRVYAAGVVRDMNFNLSIDLGADAGFKNIWIEGRKGGLSVWGHYLGKLRLGQMMEPFSLERQTSSNFGGFLERSLPAQTFAPGHNIGAMVHEASKNGRVTWAAGLFSWGKKDESNASNSLLSLTGRVTGLPMYREEGRRLLHVGASFSSRNPSSDDTRYRSRPEARFVDFLADTGNMAVSNLWLYGIEMATVQGPLWAQAEYIWTDVDAQLLGNPVFKGFYVQVGWFLTGNTKPYRRNSGVFDRLRPEENFRKGNPFNPKSGGAWELVGRISAVDLTDGEIEGGQLTDVSAALNWYISAATRLQFNYVRAIPKDRGAANIFLLRLQYNPW